MPIISSSRVLYRWLLPVVLGALVYRLLVWCGVVGYVSGFRGAAASLKPDTQPARATSLTPNPQSTPPHPVPPTYYNIRTIHHIAVNHSLTLLKMGKRCPKHVELIQRSIKLLLLHIVGHLYYSRTCKLGTKTCILLAWSSITAVF